MRPTTGVARPRDCACCCPPESRWWRRHTSTFCEAGDDDPRNGLALAPNIHWAFDKNLIALGEDLKWHVSPVLDERIHDFAPLIQLNGKGLIGPTERRFTPKRESLVFRMAHLRRHAD
ncbi:MAG: HNH endonuclease [Comamonadaceae bacterium]|nr:HNH endonuclease [Comamonadaceae bacterium]